ncbi:androgen-induced gene 1 protein isoform X4 [Tamandua tetradactyla]|uniref:androgen-induced gene 1 protein isoform X4 n=1 Tax=Tamandua tetradactyla TaxID=48850 RepID=UPI004053D3F4
MALVPCQVLRAAILLSYCSVLCNYKAIEMPSHQTYGGSWKFLTFIDLGRPPSPRIAMWNNSRGHISSGSAEHLLVSSVHLSQRAAHPFELDQQIHPALEVFNPAGLILYSLHDKIMN